MCRVGNRIIKGEKLEFLNNAREAGILPTQVLRDAATTYITAFKQVISMKKVKTKITPINSFR